LVVGSCNKFSSLEVDSPENNKSMDLLGSKALDVEDPTAIGKLIFIYDYL
jgi:hypothetical protein